MVSEVVCRALLSYGGLSVLEAFTVFASPNFSYSWNANSSCPFPIVPGLYFGTRFRDDVESGPPTRVNMVHTVGDIVDLWAFDSWLCNLDRATEGNMLLQPSGDGPTFRIIAADQSDCFCGSESLASGEWHNRDESETVLRGLFRGREAIAASGGGHRIRLAVDRARTAFARLDEAFDEVPGEWWAASGIAPEQLRNSLYERLRRLTEILNADQWGNFDHAQFANIPQL